MLRADCELEAERLMLEIEAGEWEHILRDALQRAVWTVAAQRRMDMQGIQKRKNVQTAKR